MLHHIQDGMLESKLYLSSKLDYFMCEHVNVFALNSVTYVLRHKINYINLLLASINQ